MHFIFIILLIVWRQLWISSFYLNIIVNDIVNAQSSCSNNWESNPVSSEQIPLLYGPFDTEVMTYILFISKHEGETIIGSSFNLVVPSWNVIYVNQYYYPVILLKNVITGSGTMRNGGIINIIKQVQQSYLTQNKTLIANQLTNAVDLPWSGVIFNQNSLTKIISCSNTFPQISFTCANNTTPFILPMTNREISSITLGTASKMYSFSFLNQSMSLDLNQFQMNNNTMNTILGNNIAPIIFVQGFTRVSHSSNNISNCGRFIYFAAYTWKFLARNSKSFLDRTANCIGDSKADTYGFF